MKRMTAIHAQIKTFHSSESNRGVGCRPQQRHPLQAEWLQLLQRTAVTARRWPACALSRCSQIQVRLRDSILAGADTANVSPMGKSWDHDRPLRRVTGLVWLGVLCTVCIQPCASVASEQRLRACVIETCHLVPSWHFEHGSAPTRLAQDRSVLVHERNRHRAG